MKNIATIILAAGSSIRLGQAKQLVEFQNESLVKRTVRTVLNTGSDKVVIVLGAYHESIRHEIEEFDMAVIFNAEYDQGMGNSISAGVRHATTKWNSLDGIMILLTDQPLLESSFLEKLYQSFVAHENRIISAAYSGTFGPPVIFPPNLFERLIALQGDKGAKKIIKQYDDNLTTIVNEKLGLDIDHPSDLEKLRNMGF